MNELTKLTDKELLEEAANRLEDCVKALARQDGYLDLVELRCNRPANIELQLADEMRKRAGYTPFAVTYDVGWSNVPVTVKLYATGFVHAETVGRLQSNAPMIRIAGLGV